MDTTKTKDSATSTALTGVVDILLGDVVKEVKETTEKKLKEIDSTISIEVQKTKNQLTDLSNYIDSVKGTSPLVVTLGDVKKPKKTLVHSAFDKVIKVLTSAKRKEKNIMLVGGAGGGKTHLASTIAEALKLPFYPMSVGLQTTKSDLLGFINAQGNYVTTPIRQAYENGGVLLLDEFDATHAGVVTILNSLLANGHCSFPDKIVEKHKDFVCLCACNTYGKGATMEYVGRNRLDSATLDRFIIIDVGYDSMLEDKLTDNKDWYAVIKNLRSNADKYGTKIIISPRASMDGADLLDAGFTIEDVLDMVVFKGVTKDVKDLLLKGIDLKKLSTVDEPTPKK